jgi:hypothetical protein
MRDARTGLVATAALALTLSLAAADRSWAVSKLEIFETESSEFMERAFFDGEALSNTSRTTEPFPGLRFPSDMIGEEDTDTEISFFNGEFVAGGACVPKEDSDCISFKNVKRRDGTIRTAVSNFESDPFDPTEAASEETFIIKDTRGNPVLQVVVSSVREPIPEPQSWALMITGFSLAGYALRRRRALA